MTLLNDALDYVVGQFTAAGVPATADPRNVRLPGVLVEPPTITTLSKDMVTLRFPALVLAPPPGNLDAVRVLLEVVDLAVAGVDNCTSGEPTTYGEKDTPAYLLNVTVTARRDPS